VIPGPLQIDDVRAVASKLDASRNGGDLATVDEHPGSRLEVEWNDLGRNLTGDPEASHCQRAPPHHSVSSSESR
jgi:hypothetical protein